MLNSNNSFNIIVNQIINYKLLYVAVEEAAGTNHFLKSLGFWASVVIAIRTGRKQTRDAKWTCGCGSGAV